MNMIISKPNANQDIRILPETGFLRLSQVLRFIPVGKTTWWTGIKTGRFPKGVNLGGRVTAWKVEDIKELIERLGNQ